MSQLISVTTNAVDQIKKILLEAPIGTDALVVGVDKSGCSGYSYKLDFGKSSEFGDYESITKDGVKILIDPAGMSDVSKTWYKDVAINDVFSEGTTMHALPLAKSEEMIVDKLRRGWWSFIILATTPIDSFTAKVNPLIGGLWIFPSNLSAMEA